MSMSLSCSTPLPYHSGDVADALHLTPFGEHCTIDSGRHKRRLLRGKFSGICGGDPAQRQHPEALEFFVDRASEKRTLLQVEPHSRSAAGKVVEPRLLRHPLALEKSMHFLVQHYLRRPHTSRVYTDPFKTWSYLWDRLRGIRTAWIPQLPFVGAQAMDCIDESTGQLVPADTLQQESRRRIRWLEFTVAALSVGGAYLCSTPDGCRRFLQEKKNFLESMSQCFTDLTVYYRSQPKYRHAEFFSLLLLLYGLNQESKSEDRAMFCKFNKEHMNDGNVVLCPERPASSVNLSQAYKELERQPHMMETKPVRTAMRLIHCWASRSWFEFLYLCRHGKLTPLQRTMVFQSFTYVRFRAVLDLVLPNSYVYAKLRIRGEVPIVELADLLLLEKEHCIVFLKAMGLGPFMHNESTLRVCDEKAFPLISAEEIEEHCSTKEALFLPTFPEYFGFRVWHEAFEWFPELAHRHCQQAGDVGATSTPCSPTSSQEDYDSGVLDDTRHDGADDCDDYYTDERSREGASKGHASEIVESAPLTEGTHLTPSGGIGWRLTTSDEAMLRQPGCPVCWMELLEPYCPPYHDDVEALPLVDAPQNWFEDIRADRQKMLWRSILIRQNALASGDPQTEDEHNLHNCAPTTHQQALQVHKEELLEAADRESISTTSSLFADTDTGILDSELPGIGFPNPYDGPASPSAEGSCNIRDSAERFPDGDTTLAVVRDAQALVKAISESPLYQSMRARQNIRPPTVGVGASAPAVPAEESVLSDGAGASSRKSGDEEVTDPCRTTVFDYSSDAPEACGPPHFPRLLALPAEGNTTVTPLPDDYPVKTSPSLQAVVESPQTTLGTPIETRKFPSCDLIVMDPEGTQEDIKDISVVATEPCSPVKSESRKFTAGDVSVSTTVPLPSSLAIAPASAAPPTFRIQFPKPPSGTISFLPRAVADSTSPTTSVDVGSTTSAPSCVDSECVPLKADSGSKRHRTEDAVSQVAVDGKGPHLSARCARTGTIPSFTESVAHMPRGEHPTHTSIGTSTSSSEIYPRVAGMGLPVTTARDANDFINGENIPAATSVDKGGDGAVPCTTTETLYPLDLTISTVEVAPSSRSLTPPPHRQPSHFASGRQASFSQLGGACQASHYDDRRMIDVAPSSILQQVSPVVALSSSFDKNLAPQVTEYLRDIITLLYLPRNGEGGIRRCLAQTLLEADMSESIRRRWLQCVRSGKTGRNTFCASRALAFRLCCGYSPVMVPRSRLGTPSLPPAAITTTKFSFDKGSHLPDLEHVIQRAELDASLALEGSLRGSSSATAQRLPFPIDATHLAGIEESIRRMPSNGRDADTRSLRLLGKLHEQVPVEECRTLLLTACLVLVSTSASPEAIDLPSNLHTELLGGNRLPATGARSEAMLSNEVLRHLYAHPLERLIAFLVAQPPGEGTRGVQWIGAVKRGTSVLKDDRDDTSRVSQTGHSSGNALLARLGEADCFYNVRHCGPLRHLGKRARVNSSDFMRQGDNSFFVATEVRVYGALGDTILHLSPCPDEGLRIQRRDDISCECGRKVDTEEIGQMVGSPNMSILLCLDPDDTVQWTAGLETLEKVMRQAAVAAADSRAGRSYIAGVLVLLVSDSFEACTECESFLRRRMHDVWETTFNSYSTCCTAEAARSHGDNRPNWRSRQYVSVQKATFKGDVEWPRRQDARHVNEYDPEPAVCTSSLMDGGVDSAPHSIPLIPSPIGSPVLVFQPLVVCGENKEEASKRSGCRAYSGRRHVPPELAETAVSLGVQTLLQCYREHVGLAQKSCN